MHRKVQTGDDQNRRGEEEKERRPILHVVIVMGNQLFVELDDPSLHYILRMALTC